MANTQMERCPACQSEQRLIRKPVPEYWEGTSVRRTAVSVNDLCSHDWHSTPAAPETPPKWEPGPNITGTPVHEWGTPNSEAEEACEECGSTCRITAGKHNLVCYHCWLEKKVSELQKWKESQIAVTPDMQEIAKLLDVPLGKSVHDRIIPGIQGLREALRQIAEPFSEPELDEHAKQLGAIGMCGINQPLWETRREINMYIEKHFLPKRAETPRKEEA